MPKPSCFIHLRQFNTRYLKNLYIYLSATHKPRKCMFISSVHQSGIWKVKIKWKPPCSGWSSKQASGNADFPNEIFQDSRSEKQTFVLILMYQKNNLLQQIKKKILVDSVISHWHEISWFQHAFTYIKQVYSMLTSRCIHSQKKWSYMYMTVYNKSMDMLWTGLAGRNISHKKNSVIKCTRIVFYGCSDYAIKGGGVSRIKSAY